jgi:hypothetical protein
MTRVALLPASSTALERAVSETADRMPELSVGVEDLHGFKFDPTPVLVPYLILEYGLGEIEGYVGDAELALREGITWQRLRGTPAALHRALKWVDADGVLEENPAYRFKWWWFQVHLPDPRPDSKWVTPMIGVAKASKPLRSEFARVTAGYDKRGFILNGSRYNGGALLNSWSGIRRAVDQPVLSLRWPHLAPVFDNSLYEPVMMIRQDLSRRYKINGGAPVDQKSSFPQSFGAPIAGYSDPAVVPFDNAPFSATEAFGVPNPRIQKDY